MTPPLPVRRPWDARSCSAASPARESTPWCPYSPRAVRRRTQRVRAIRDTPSHSLPRFSLHFSSRVLARLYQGRKAPSLRSTGAAVLSARVARRASSGSRAIALRMRAWDRSGRLTSGGDSNMNPNAHCRIAMLNLNIAKYKRDVNNNISIADGKSKPD